MKWNKKFEYPASIRSSVEGKSHYEITRQKLPSVTTILSATQSAEKKKKLEEWKQRVGTQQADRIRDVSAMRGTAMHTYLEGYILGKNHMDLTSIGREAERMGKVGIETGTGDVEEVGGRGDMLE